MNGNSSRHRAFCRIPLRQKTNERQMSTRTKLFVGITVSLGMVVLCSALWHWQSADLARFACYVLRRHPRLRPESSTAGHRRHDVGEFPFHPSRRNGTKSAGNAGHRLHRPRWCKASGRREIGLDPVKVLFNVFGMMANASALCYVNLSLGLRR